MLSAETKEIVKATKPTLEQHGLAITSRLYERLFTEHPETEQLFAGSSPGQAARLADAVLAYADNIDNIEALVPVVEQIAAKHVAAGVQPAHYDIVGTALLRSMVDVLGELDIAVIEAWSEAYGVLSSVFISTEADLAAILAMRDEAANGLTLCTGSLGAHSGNDLPAIARRFADRVHFAHLRNVAREPDGSFQEAAHLEGDTDMPAVIAELLATRRDLPFRPDHGHALLSDAGARTHPGYPLIGRLRGLAELRGVIAGLRHAAMAT